MRRRSPRCSPMPADTVAMQTSTSTLSAARTPAYAAFAMSTRSPTARTTASATYPNRKPGSASRMLFWTLTGPASRRISESATSVGASKSTRADFDAAAMTAPFSPICVPTAIAEERSFTARPLQSPAADGARPAAAAAGRNASSATMLKSEMTAIAVACSSRWARATGATAFTAEAPQIIVPAARRSAIGRRTPRLAASACVTKNVLGTAATRTPATSSNSPRLKKLVCTFSPIVMMASRSTHLPV